MRTGSRSGRTTRSSSSAASAGTQYLAAKRRQTEQRRERHAATRRELHELEETLRPLADSWRQLGLLPATLTGRTEMMVFNGAYLVPRAGRDRFHAVCENLRGGYRAQGLLVEVTGPWPPYHFCPALQTK